MEVAARDDEVGRTSEPRGLQPRHQRDAQGVREAETPQVHRPLQKLTALDTGNPHS